VPERDLAALLIEAIANGLPIRDADVILLREGPSEAD
jgi:hypothetical protein